MYSEKELIDGCKKNKASFQEALYNQYASRMMGVCLRYAKTTAEAEDVFQEAFVKVFENISKFNGGSLEGWIRRIMINTAINNFRANQKRYGTVEYDAAYDTRPGGEDAISRLSNEELLALINQLPQGYKMVFNLYVIEGYNHREIGEMLHINEGTSKSQLAKARNMLVSLLEENKFSQYA